MSDLIRIVMAILICCFSGLAFCETTLDDKNGGVFVGKLSNGMRVIFKKTSFDPGEIYIRMTAEGGYASLSEEDKAAGVVSTYAALETGFGNISADHFYAEDIELSIELQEYSRTILAFTASYDFEKLLSYLNQFFRVRKFSDDAFAKAKLRAANMIKACSIEFDYKFQQAFLNANTQNFKPMKQPELESLSKTDIERSEELFKGLFANPADFTLVIVGDIDQKQMLKLAETHLGSIQSVDQTLHLEHPPIPSFPKKNEIKEVLLKGYHSSMARISFPIVSTNPKVYVTLSWLEEFLHKRLSAALEKKFNDESGLEVIFENPIFPRNELSLFIIQFRCDPKIIKKVEAVLQEELKYLCKVGISQEQMISFTKELNQKDHFWLHDNAYWLTLLADYSAMGWAIDSNTGMPVEYSGVTTTMLNTVLREIFCGSSHVFIYSKNS